MNILKSFINVASILLLALSSFPASAMQIIAHRGVYHDVNNTYVLAENSFTSVARAYTLGLKGVELDLRLDKDGTVLVTHDLIMNRTTEVDRLQGNMNPVDIALNLQKAPDPIFIAQYGSDMWNGAQLKGYGQNSKIIYSNFSGNLSSVESLDEMLDNLKNSRKDIVNDQNFMIILDIQDWRTLKSAAASVKRHGMNRNVYLKFFASKALAAGYSYNGADTCYTYEKNNDLLNTKIIPQINDGELDTYDNDDAGIYAFGKTLAIDTYLQCWADAQAQHSDAATMPIVSASVPAENWKATAGAFRAIYWAQSHGRQTMTIVPNPDAGRSISGTCRLFSFQSAKVGAVSFNMDARQAKANFAANSSVRPDYVVWDVMGDAGGRTWSTNFNYFISNIC